MCIDGSTTITPLVIVTTILTLLVRDAIVLNILMMVMIGIGIAETPACLHVIIN